MTQLKIKIDDDNDLRKILGEEYEASSQIELCKYAILLAKHILTMLEVEPGKLEIIERGFTINEYWQKGQARMHEVREASFSIHQLARQSSSVLEQTLLRVIGHAVASGHMAEHALVASDYAIKLINLLFPKDKNAIVQERLWQMQKLKEMKEYR